MPAGDKAIKLLWANAAGRCSFDECFLRLAEDSNSPHTPFVLGEMAHIKGEKPGSARHDTAQPQDERNTYENLILLCPNHHTEIDKAENVGRYPADLLIAMKKAHEAKVSNLLTAGEIRDLDGLKNRISPLLAENRQSWQIYGPQSELARKNPHNNELHRVWQYERLTKIVPNNRAISSILKSHTLLIHRKDHTTISQFLAHVDSYERWVRDEISYNAVLRFPQSFEQFINME